MNVPLSRFALVVAMALLLCAVSASGVERDDDLKRADHLKDMLQFDEAAQLYDNYLKQHPKNVNARILKALCIFWGGHSKEGIESMSEALALDPTAYGAYVHRANMQLGQKNYAAAMADLEAAMKVAPADPREIESIIGAKGDLYRHKGDYKKAVQFLTEEIEKRNPQTASMYVQLARCYVNMKELDLADKWYQVAEQHGAETMQKVEHADMWFRKDEQRALSMLDKIYSQYDDAIKAGEERPDSAFVMNHLYHLHVNRQDWRRAQNCAKWMLYLTHSSRDWLIVSAEVSLNLHEPRNALNFLEQIPNYIKDPFAVNGMIAAYHMQGQHAKAYEIAARYFGAGGDNVDVRNSIAQLLIIDGKPAEALSYMRPFEARAAANPGFWKLLSTAAGLTGDYLLSERAMTKCLAFHPKDQELFQLRAGARCKLKKFSQALADANASLSIMPNTSGEYRLRAMIYDKLHNYDAAVNDLGHALAHATKDDAGLTLLCRAQIFAAQGRWRAARDDASAASRDKGANAQAFSVLADLTEALTDEPDANMARDTAFRLALHSK